MTARDRHQHPRLVAILEQQTVPVGCYIYALVYKERLSTPDLALQSPLLFRMLDHLLFDKHSLSLPHAISVCSRNIGFVRLFTKVFQFFLGCRYPEGVLVEHLESAQVRRYGAIRRCRFNRRSSGLPVEDQLRTSSSGRSFTDLCGTEKKRQ